MNLGKEWCDAPQIAQIYSSHAEQMLDAFLHSGEEDFDAWKPAWLGAEEEREIKRRLKELATWAHEAAQ